MKLGITTMLIAAMTAVALSRAALADCLIVEAHVGERPADADEILEPFKEPLKAIGCRDARDGAQGFEHVSRPGMQVAPDTFKNYDQEVREGFQKYSEGDYDAAIELLERRVRLAEDNPAALVGQPGRRSSHRLALVGLAMAHRKLSQKAESEAETAEALVRRRGRQEAADLLVKVEVARARAAEQMKLAKERMGNVVRSFGTREIQRSEFGGETFDFYQQVKHELNAKGTTTLEVNLDDPSGVLYVNGEFADVGKINMQVLSGPTSVLVRWGSGPRALVRFYRPTLQIGLYLTYLTRRFEEALHTGPDWCCILYPSVTSWDQHLGYDIVHFGRQADRIVVLGIHPGTKSNPRSVVGRVYGLGSDGAKRHVRALLEPVLLRRQERIEVGKYWAGQRDDVPDQSARVTAWAPSVSSPRLKLGLAGFGIVGGIVGGYLIYVEAGCGNSGCAPLPQIGSGLLLGAAGLALGTAIYLEVSDRRRRSRINDLLLTFQHDSVTIGWSGLY
jgi:hypothetical protein